MDLGRVGTLVALALASGGAHGAPRGRAVVFGTEASNKELAEKQAEHELRSVKVPPGARRVETSPAPILEEALSTRGEPNLVERWKWLVAPGTVTGTLSWFRAHPPAGSHIGSENRRTGRESAASLWFEVREHSRRVEGPSVIPNVAPLGGGHVGIRLEVQQVWKTPHPAAARIPAGARLLNVSRHVGGGKPTFQVIRSARKVRRIGRAIDFLPAEQPQETFWNPCEAVSYVPGERKPRRVEVRMRFRAHEAGPLLAEATMGMPARWCEPMSLKITGESGAFSLEDGGTVVALLHH